jgi:hypothetical protein
MDLNATILIDPVQHEVHLPDRFREMLSDQGFLDSDLDEVIRKPAMAFKMAGPIPSLYHLRAIDWDLTVLLQSEWKGNYWLVSDCILNPDTMFTSSLLANSRVSFVYPRD